MNAQPPAEPITSLRPAEVNHPTPEAAKLYTRRGWSVIPIPRGTKAPRTRGWQNLRLTLDTLHRYFPGGPQNIGVLMGEPSGGLVDVDLDHMRAVELAPEYLPPTAAIFGRSGKRRSHWLYRVTGPLNSQQYSSRAAGMVVEIRSTGKQTVFPPSLHPSGEAIGWHGAYGPPSDIDPMVLANCVGGLAKTVLQELGEQLPVSHLPAPNPEPQPQQSAPSIELTGTAASCLAAMMRLPISDQRDGSRRLYRAACRTVEYDLDDDTAVAVICGYAARRKFPRDWTPDDILQRIRDAEKACRRGSALDRNAEKVPLGNRDPRSGRTVLSTRQTLPTAEAYIHDFHRHPDARTLHCYGGQLLEWTGNRFEVVEEAAVKCRLQMWLHDSLHYHYDRATKEETLADFPANPATIGAALDSLKTYVHIPDSTASPSWLEPAVDRPPAHEIIACKSVLLHLPTMRSLAPTPQYFNRLALNFDFKPDAPAAAAWQSFVGQLFGQDVESINLLQEWMGYCLTGDTSQQKMLLVVGPRRSGKGTIARVLTQLMGPDNVCGPTTSSLAGTFGLQPLIGKSLAIVSDARFRGESTSTVVERLLCVSGEDSLTIDRKYLPSVTLKLPTRFMMLTNELPHLTDASGALAGRFVVLRLTQSYFGREDLGLTDRLLLELPAIMNWAIQGWHRLHARGSFAMPSSAGDALRDLEDMSSPVAAFVGAECIVGPGHRVGVADLYAAWRSWCRHEGWQNATSPQMFGRDLAAAVPGVKRRRGTDKRPFYECIGLQDHSAR